VGRIEGIVERDGHFFVMQGEKTLPDKVGRTFLNPSIQRLTSKKPFSIRPYDSSLLREGPDSEMVDSPRG